MSKDFYYIAAFIGLFLFELVNWLLVNLALILNLNLQLNTQLCALSHIASVFMNYLYLRFRIVFF